MHRYVLIDANNMVDGMMWSELPIDQAEPPTGMTIAAEVEKDEDYPVGKVYKDGYFIAPPEALDDEQKATRLIFRTLATANTITAAEAVDNASMFPLWLDSIGQQAVPGSYYRHNDKLWRVNAGQGHAIQADWAPDKAVSLFSLAANPAEEWPEWIQPTGAHNAYAKGAQVSYKSKKWVSTADANVWAPGMYGWTETA